jgi:hypothetical protein
VTYDPRSPASLSTAIGSDGWRCEGIRTWADVELLGRGNCASLREFAQEAASRALSEGNRDMLSEIGTALQRLARIESTAASDKPLLPRLRRESFRKGQDVRLYLGEIQGAPVSWMPASIASVEKSFNVDWKGFEPNSGYYWRLTASLITPVHGLPSQLSFSTSEPRVLPEEEYRWFHRFARGDRRFVEIFAENSRREWQPLWCQELGITIDVSGMDPNQWLMVGR